MHGEAKIEAYRSSAPHKQRRDSCVKGRVELLGESIEFFFPHLEKEARCTLHHEVPSFIVEKVLSIIR